MEFTALKRRIEEETQVIQGKEISGLVMCGQCNKPTKFIKSSYGQEEHYCAECHLSYKKRGLEVI